MIKNNSTDSDKSRAGRKRRTLGRARLIFSLEGAERKNRDN